MRSITVHFDINTRKVYSESGSQLGADTFPYIRFREKIELTVKYVTEPVDLTPYT